MLTANFLLLDRTNSTIVHQHYAKFTMHPGITTLIACAVIAILLLAYMWAENIRQFYRMVKKKSCCFQSESGLKKSTKEEIEMEHVQSQCSSFGKESKKGEDYFTSANDCQSLDGITSPSGDSTSSEALLQPQGCPVLLASIEVKGFPKSPMILLTPATPLPSAHSSIAMLNTLDNTNSSN